VVDLFSSDRERHDMNGVCEQTGQPRKTVLILTAPGTVSTSLIHAIKRELPWLTVEESTDASSVLSPFRHPLALILVDTSRQVAIEASASAIGRMHPHALVALIEQNLKDRSHSLESVASSAIVRSILPMNLRLDIWLSVVRLMLNGGEYIPPQSGRQNPSGPTPATSTIQPSLSAISANNRHAPPTAGHPALEGLTSREMQVLEMVARGLQNKSIAAAFQLSEHTVKIHLHNIIAKLGVHNRTEAAARFRERLVGRDQGNSH
jgi:DNA-binding NarL/FixJ family response regulator